MGDHSKSARFRNTRRSRRSSLTHRRKVTAHRYLNQVLWPLPYESELVPLLTWRSAAHLAVEVLDEAPLVPVVVRYDPASCGPDVAPPIPLLKRPRPRTTWADTPPPITGRRQDG
jgi:hypothetical protein